MRERPAPLVSLAAAFAVAVIAVLPAIVAMWTSPSFPVRTFTVDDGLYLQRSIGAWHGHDPYQWTYFENAGTRPLADVAVARPNAVTDIAVGWIAATLGLTPAGLAVFLDWTCAALSLALFAAIFRRFCPWSGEWLVWNAAILAVAFPGTFVPDPVLQLPNATFPFLVSEGFVDPSPPVFRAVYTQASYPLFLLAVLQMTRVYLRREPMPATTLLAGMLGGLCGFGYFFPWLTALALGLALPIARAFVSPEVRIRETAAAMTIFLGGWLAGSLGVLAIMKISAASGIVATDLLARHWWLPVERVILAAALLAVAIRASRGEEGNARVLAALALLVALEIPLMNVQPVLREGLAPYHFPSFYLYPLVSGLGFLTIVNALAERFSLPVVARVLSAMPFAMYVFDAGTGVNVARQPPPLARDLGWLVEKLQAEPPGTVFAMNPVRNPFRDKPVENGFRLSNYPNFVATLSGRYTLEQEWMFHELDDTSDLRRELGMSWLLTGTMRPLWTPPVPVAMPGDIFTLTWTYLELRREQKLALHESLFHEYTPCRFVSDFRLDVFVHEQKNDGPLAPPAERFLTSEAKSPDGIFEVFRFDRERATAALCGDGAKQAAP